MSDIDVDEKCIRTEIKVLTSTIKEFSSKTISIYSIEISSLYLIYQHFSLNIIGYNVIINK